MKKIRVFVVDDHEMIRLGVREALAHQPDIEVVGEAGGFDDAIKEIPDVSPDVALLDIRLQDGDGAQLCRHLRRAAVPVRCLMYTSATEDEAIYDAIEAGAYGYILKDSARAELISAIRNVAMGRSMIDAGVASKVLARIRTTPREPGWDLTEQEGKVFDLLGRGMTNREIADELSLAEQTIKNYVSRVLTKLDMHRTQAAIFAASRARAPRG